MKRHDDHSYAFKTARQVVLKELKDAESQLADYKVRQHGSMTSERWDCSEKELVDLVVVRRNQLDMYDRLIQMEDAVLTMLESKKDQDEED